jgi:hypothetical protein
MKSATHSPLFATKELLETRYSGAEAIFVAGSVVRGEATAYSDLDLVVMYRELPFAYRESFTHLGWPVEAFIHDPDTLKYFFLEVDRPIGRATLAEMVGEGHEIPGPTPFTDELKALARDILNSGPPPLNDEDLLARRYHISELIDDMREPRSRQDLVAVAALVYSELADYYFRSHRTWTGSGKAILKRMKSRDPGLARKFADAFESVFTGGQTAGVIALAEEMLIPEGGCLFDGYRLEAPSTWRIKT